MSVALASGFKSLRRFNVALKERYRLTPTELRRHHRQNDAAAAPGDEFSFRLGYRKPLDWDELLRFLGGRAIPQVEQVGEGTYARTVCVVRAGKEYTGVLHVRHDATARVVIVRLSETLLPVCAAVLDRVKRLFDLGADPLAINAVLGTLAAASPGLRVPGSFNGFEMAVRAILGQQISVAAARTLAGRIVQRFGRPIKSDEAALSHLFPEPARLARATVSEIAALGIIGRRAETLIALARAMASGELRLEPGARVEGTLAQLRKIPGIGEWTAQYMAMRGLSWPDAFPHRDLGIQKALGEKNAKKILTHAEQWRPWRAYAVLHLWAQLGKQTETKNGKATP